PQLQRGQMLRIILIHYSFITCSDMNEVVLNPVFHPGVCVLLIIAIVVLFAWKEFPFGKKTIVMILPITLVNIALAGLLLRPSFVKKESSSPTIVLTKGYDRKK